MIEQFLDSLVNELGATGLLVIGLYWILGQPLKAMAKSLKVINGEIGQIRDLIKNWKGCGNG